MSQIRAEHRPLTKSRTRKPGATVRIGYGGAAEGEGNRPMIWLTPIEARRIAAELIRAAAEAEKAQQTPTQESSPCTS